MRINTRQNKNTTGITGITFGISNKFFREQDLNNDMMLRLLGNEKFEDSLFNEEEKSRYSSGFDK